MTRRAIVIAVVVVVGVFTGGLLLGRLISRPESRAVPEPSAPSTQPSPSESTPGTRPNFVPDLSGLLLSQAVQVLGSVHLATGDLTARVSPYDRGTVLSQGLKPGSLSAVGEVALVLSAGPHPDPVVFGGERRAEVGGTCDLLYTPGPTLRPACAGGVLYVPFAPTPIRPWVGG